MITLTISVPEKSLQKLHELVMRFSVTPEKLAQVSLEELLTRPEEDFKQVLDYVVQKNAELYRLLA